MFQISCFQQFRLQGRFGSKPRRVSVCVKSVSSMRYADRLRVYQSRPYSGIIVQGGYREVSSRAALSDGALAQVGEAMTADRPEYLTTTFWKSRHALGIFFAYNILGCSIF